MGNQGDREGRPYNTTKRLAKIVYGTGDPCGRPGKTICCILGATLALAVNVFHERRMSP